MNEKELGLAEMQDLQDDEEPPSRRHLKKTASYGSYVLLETAERTPKGRNLVQTITKKLEPIAANLNRSYATPCFIDGTSGGC